MSAVDEAIKTIPITLQIPVDMLEWGWSREDREELAADVAAWKVRLRDEVVRTKPVDFRGWPY